MEDKQKGGSLGNQSPVNQSDQDFNQQDQEDMPQDQGSKGGQATVGQDPNQQDTDETSGREEQSDQM